MDQSSAEDSPQNILCVCMCVCVCGGGGGGGGVVNTEDWFHQETLSIITMHFFHSAINVERVMWILKA